MLNRLISNLPFNPRLVEELSFYGKRLRKERSIRRLGFVMIVLSMLVQVLAASIPAEKSLAESDNDLIRGGISTKRQLLNAWDNPNTHIADIYGKFGVTRHDISSIPGNKPNARIKSDASNFWSVGRNSLTGYSDVLQQYKDKEVAIKTAGPTVFLRPLSAWDRGGRASVYDAFRGRNSTTGETFWIIASCGNYTQNGPGKLPPPQLEVRKTIVGNVSTVTPGAFIKFRIEYRNKQEDSLAEDVRIIDNLQLEKFTLVSPNDLNVGGNNKFEKNVGNLRYTDNSHIFDITVKAKSNLRNGVRICNSVRLKASNAPEVTGGGAPGTCVTVSSHATTVTKTSTVAPPAAPVTVATTASAPVNMPPSLSKNVWNVTQNLKGRDAMQSTVLPGDVLEYTLTTYNSRQADMTGYNIRDFVGDVTDYADIDRAFLAGQDGTYNDKTKEVVWANQTLKAGQDNTKRFRVKIKDPVPGTNSPSNISTNFDCQISNEYGNEVSMYVQCPVIKSMETLPNTGPGSAIFISFGLVSFSGYFLARNGLISKELLIIRRTYASSGDK